MLRSLWLYMSLLCLLGASPALMANEGLFDDLDEAIFAGDTVWWNDGWRYRQRIEITDPRAKMRSSAFARLEAPLPLFFYNTGRTMRGLRDVRFVSADREVLQAGVVNWRQDDDTSHVWVRLPRVPSNLLGGDRRLRMTMYYGYEGDDELPPLPEAPILELDHAPFLIRLDAEEVRPGAEAAPWPDAEAFFRDLVVVEGERLTDAQGRDGFVHSNTPDRRTFAITNLQPASGGAYMAPDYPWRRPVHDDYPVVFHGSAELPSGGTWYVHVRYPVTSYVILQGQLTPKRVSYHLYPYQVRIGEHLLTCGASQEPGAKFRYDHFELELPAGQVPIEVTMEKVAGIDCIVFTRDPDYQPDIADFSGEIHMRYKITQSPLESFIVAPFCVITPWSTHGPQGKYAGYLLRDQVAPTPIDLEIAQRDPANFLTSDVWTPWIAMLTSQMPTWWTAVHLLPPGPGRPLGGANYQFEIATRPHPSRVFRRGEERAELASGLHILMPSRIDIETTLRDTLSFGQWAEQRYQTVLDLGLNVVKRPEKILVTTMATSVSAMETEYIMRTVRALGFNGAEIRSPLDQEAYWALSDSLGLEWATAHHWHPKLDYTTWPEAPAEGQSYTEAGKALVNASAAYTYAPDGARWRYATPRTRLLIMGDEIGPATNPPIINNVPLMKGWFHEYLREQGLTPEFFGRESWDEVDAHWYREVSLTSELGEAVQRIRAARGLPVEDPYAPDAPREPDADLTRETLPEEGVDLLEAMTAAEDERQAAERISTAPADASLHDKRLYHWSQKFRGVYTYHVYGASQREINRQTELGNFLHLPYASPNFQALPIMRAQMWDGALNLFEWAREDTTNTLLIEDWIVHPYRVGFGFQILRSAARKHQQKLGFLVVGGRMNQRYYAALANGSEVFLSYLYGPLRVIGPPWASDEETMRMWSSALETTARCEDDLLAARPRPAEVAILVAVTSDLNSTYINPNPIGYQMGDRASISAVLQDSQIPSEVISEEELLDEPDALSRYKVLYVADPHVDSRVQGIIREWVANGGVLWGNYMAMARQEYDEPAKLMDEVFGLRERAPLENIGRLADWTELARSVTVPAGIEGLLPVTFDSSPVKSAWKVADGVDVLATFSDGEPAFIRHGWGKGRAYLFAGTVHPLTGGYGRLSSEPPYAAAARRLVTLACDEAGVERHLSLDRPRVMSYVNDGPEQNIVFLINCFEEDVTGVKVRVKLPRRPTSAYNGNGEPFEWTWEDGEASFQIDIPQLDGRIIVFK